MTKKNNTIENFPLDKIEKSWPFGEFMAMELFYNNSFQPYYSFKDFLIDVGAHEFTTYNDDSWSNLLFIGFFIENERVFLKDFHGKIYTLENVPYQFIVCNAIKYQLNNYYNNCSTIPTKNKKEYMSFHWSLILEYLLITAFPVRKMLEKQNYIKEHKKIILEGFYEAFIGLTNSQIKDFLSNFKVKSFPKSLVKFYSPLESSKERLLSLLIFSEIPKKEAEKLTEKCFLTEEFTEVIFYYKHLLSKL